MVKDILFILIVIIISQCIWLSKHHIVNLKYIQCLFVTVSIKLEKIKTKETNSVDIWGYSCGNNSKNNCHLWKSNQGNAFLI